MDRTSFLFLPLSETLPPTPLILAVFDWILHVGIGWYLDSKFAKTDGEIMFEEPGKFRIVINAKANIEVDES